MKYCVNTLLELMSQYRMHRNIIVSSMVLTPTPFEYFYPRLYKGFPPWLDKKHRVPSLLRRNVSYSNEKKWIPFPKVILCTSKGTIKVTRSENYVFINVILIRSLQCAWLLIANVFFRFIGKFFTFYGISQSYMSSLKCGILILCEFPILFQQSNQD